MKNKSLLALIVSILTLSKINTSTAAQVQIAESATTNTSTVTDNDTILFAGTSSGTLNNDSTTKTLGTITTNNNGIGTITINGSQTLITSSIGTADKKISGINFTTLGSTLEVRGNIYTQNGITTTASAGGSIDVSGSGINIVGNIGSSSNRFTQIVVLSSSSATFHNNLFTDAFTINSSNSTATLYGTNSVLGTISLNDNSRLNLYGNATATTLSTSASATSTLHIGSKTQLNLSGAATFNSLSTLSIGVDNSSSGGSSASIASSGAVTLNAATTINLDYSKASYLKVGNSYKFLTTTGALTASATQATVTDNSFLLAPTVTNTTGANGFSTVTQNLDSTNHDLLDTEDEFLADFLINTNLTAIDDPRTALLRLSTQTEVEDALSTLKADRSNMLQRTAMSISNAIGNIIDSHLQNANYAAFDKQSSSDMSIGNIWGEVFGATSTQNDVKVANSKSKTKGYDANFSGVIFGADTIIKDGQINSIWGASLSYTIADAKSDAISNQKTDINSYGLNFYNHNIASDGLGFFNENTAGTSYNQYDSNKQIKIGDLYSSKSKAKYSGIQYEAKVGFGYNIGITDRTIFAPIASIKYFGLQMQDYTEKNEDGLGMKVANSNFNLITSELGFKIVDDIGLFNFSWLRNLNTTGAKSSSSFTNDSSNQKLKSTGIDLDANIFNVGGQLNFKTSQNTKIILKYDLQKSTNFISHLGSVKFNCEF